MGRKRKYSPEGAKDPELDISSLVDVAFLLLIYFLVTSTLKKDETDLSIILPTSIPTDNPDPVDPLAILIEADGRVIIDKTVEVGGARPKGSKPDKRPLLREKLREYKELADGVGSKPVVIVAAADEGNTQRFIDVVNALAFVKIKNITMTGFSGPE